MGAGARGGGERRRRTRTGGGRAEEDEGDKIEITGSTFAYIRRRQFFKGPGNFIRAKANILRAAELCVKNVLFLAQKKKIHPPL